MVISHGLIAQGDTETWYANTWAFEHMTDHKEWFTDLEEYPPGRHSVLVANDRSLLVQGIGDINIQRTINKVTKRGILKGVLYIPNLKRNLFSIG
jgi:hypothetical protein